MRNNIRRPNQNAKVMVVPLRLSLVMDSLRKFIDLYHFHLSRKALQKI